MSMEVYEVCPVVGGNHQDDFDETRNGREVGWVMGGDSEDDEDFQIEKNEWISLCAPMQVNRILPVSLSSSSDSSRV